MAICFGANPIATSFISNEDIRLCFEIADSRLRVHTRPALEKHIHQLLTEMRMTTIEKLNFARMICISSDIWTKKGMSSSYLGVMATFFDPKTDQKENIVLAVRKFESTHHTALNIIKEMDDVLQIYKVPKEKIWKVITDSGSNMVCAFRDSSELDDDAAESEFHERTDNNAEDTYNYFQYSRLSCFIHTLLLCLKKFDARKLFENLITKLKSLVQKFSSSQVLTGELLKLCGLKLVSFSNTRWNTVFLVVQRLVLVKDAVITVLTDSGKLKYNLSSSEWNLMTEVKDFLAPFNKYTDMCSNEGSRPISEVIMIIKELKEHLKRFGRTRNFITVSNEVLQDIEKRFGHFFHESDERPLEGVYLASTLLDPRYRIGLTATEIEKATVYILTSISKEIREAGTENVEIVGMSSSRENYEDVPAKKRKFRFLELIPKSNTNQGLRTELDLYLGNKGLDTDDDKFDPWRFWSAQKDSFQHLSPLALDILSIPLSIGAVERTFSFAGLATQGRRNSLDGEHLEREVLLNKNKHLLK